MALFLEKKRLGGHRCISAALVALMVASGSWTRRAAVGLWLCSLPRVLSVALKPDSPTVKYGLVFDAGSSGTRVHVYSWRIGGGGPKDSFDLIEDDIIKIKPGLSAFKEEPSMAGASLRPLLEHAKTRVPAGEVATTPVFLMATAGLRLVGDGPKDAILSSVCDELSASGFLFRREWVSLLGGQDEGLYGWVTVNYLMEALYPPALKPSVGIIDLGGGSVQIVYETPAHVVATSEAQILTFGSRAHPLYVKSHLGYGLDETRKAFIAALAERRAGATTGAISHPCLPKRATQTIDGVEYTGEGDWARCSRQMGKLFKPSITEGQPPLAEKFFGFSYM
jgi:Golgi nucleoside diphosphatase